MRGQTKGTDSSRKLLNFKKPQAKMYNHMDQSISKKQNGKKITDEGQVQTPL